MDNNTEGQRRRETLQERRLRLSQTLTQTSAENPPIKGPSLGTRKVSRRAVVYAGGVGLISLGLGLLKGSDILKLVAGENPPVQAPPETFLPDSQLTPTPEITAVPEYLIEDYQLLNEALAQPIDYPQPKKGEEFKPSKRQIKEKEYLNKCLAEKDSKRKLEMIDRGFTVLGDYRLRMQLLDERWKLRQEQAEELGLRRLAEEEISWAKNQTNSEPNAGIHPEVLAICTDAYFQAKELLQQLKAEKGEKFLRYLRPDLYLLKDRGEIRDEELKSITIDDLLINPGAMAELVCSETDPKIPPHPTTGAKYYRYGFASIGHLPAFPQLRTNVAVETEEQQKETEKQQTALRDLCSITSQNTLVVINNNQLKLHYNHHRVAGSQAAQGDARGGAVGLQFMPVTALEEYGFQIESFGFGFNPFGLDATVGAYIMLSRGSIEVNQQTGEKYNPRNGYLKGRDNLGETLRFNAVQRWNNHQGEITVILKAANSYYERIVQPQIFEGKVVPVYKNKPLVFSPLLKKAA